MCPNSTGTQALALETLPDLSLYIPLHLAVYLNLYDTLPKYSISQSSVSQSSKLLNQRKGVVGTQDFIALTLGTLSWFSEDRDHSKKMLVLFTQICI